MTDQLSPARRFGHDFIRALYHVIHSARIYQDNNQLIRKSVRSFQAILDEMTVEGDVNLALWRGRFHVGGEKLSHRRDTIGVINAMSDFFSKRGIVSVNFLQSSRNATPDSILTFARLIGDSIKEGAPQAWLDKRLREEGCLWAQILQMQGDQAAHQDGNPEGNRFNEARSAYVHAVETVREVASKASQGIVGVRKARRLAQTIVDLIRDDAALMIGLSTIKDYDDYTYTHSVNVALLSTCLGRHIGLSDVALEYLTVCGLFHDLGKVGVDKDILLKQGMLTDSEWEQMKAHPLIGVRKILLLNAPQQLRSRILLGPFEHHLNPDMTGYPKTLFMDSLSLLGKILRIADVYEALTSQRAYRSRSYAPDEALRKMWREAGKNFDSVLLKRFISMMGIYPIGSVVELSDQSVALVMDYPGDSESGIPLVLRLVDDGSGALKRGDMVFLPRQNHKADPERLTIVRGLLPAGLGVNPAEYFLHVK
jgi:HD-GYP domain-containing protein (c-di-GMP phosphodiesterase class II)